LKNSSIEKPTNTEAQKLFHAKNFHLPVSFPDCKNSESHQPPSLHKGNAESSFEFENVT